LREQGLRVGLAGNQTARAERILRSLPTAGFLDRIVSDRLDNDIRPAQAAGMATALIRRSPWGYILEDPPSVAACPFHLRSLSELPELVAEHNAQAQ
jgi:FMN phosphatase YigB (HAD superfamily)